MQENTDLYIKNNNKNIDLHIEIEGFEELFHIVDTTQIFCDKKSIIIASLSFHKSTQELSCTWIRWMIK